jgi:hypothetical protein
MNILNIITMLSVMLDYNNLSSIKLDSVKDEYISKIENYNKQINLSLKDKL